MADIQSTVSCSNTALSSHRMDQLGSIGCVCHYSANTGSKETKIVPINVRFPWIFILLDAVFIFKSVAH